jgi:hypothetical protein
MVYSDVGPALVAVPRRADKRQPYKERDCDFPMANSLASVFHGLSLGEVPVPSMPWLVASVSFGW